MVLGFELMTLKHESPPNKLCGVDYSTFALI